MRHNVDGRKFGRNTSHRVAMLKNLANSIIEQERVVTTAPKAKEARRVVDRLITLAKKGDEASRRLAFARTRNDGVVEKLFDTLAARYKDRKGGYTRVLKLSDRRWGDAAEMAVIELVDHAEIVRGKAAVKKAEKPAVDAAAAAAPADPFAKIRRLFSSKKKTAVAKK
jgi:large subunit ribosomal protein L17